MAGDWQASQPFVSNVSQNRQTAEIGTRRCSSKMKRKSEQAVEEREGGLHVSRALLGTMVGNTRIQTKNSKTKHTRNRNPTSTPSNTYVGHTTHHTRNTNTQVLPYVDTHTHVAEGEAVSDENPVLARRDSRRVRNADVVFLAAGREQERRRSYCEQAC